MSTLGDPGLPPDGRAAVAVALAADPVLAAELDAIAAALLPEAREAFWRSFAAGCLRRERPAAAVLGALEDAARAAGP